MKPKPTLLTSIAAIAVAALLTSIGALPASAHLASAAKAASTPPGWVLGPPGFAMAEPAAGVSRAAARPASSSAPINASYTHTPPSDSSQDLPPGSGDIMPSTTLNFVFWLPTGQSYEGTAAGDTNYENLLIRWAQDVGATQYHNLVTQYNGTNGTIGNTVSFGASWVDTSAYPHAGTVADPLTDSDIQAEVQKAVAANGWTEDLNHMVLVFTATGIQECMSSSSCTFSSNGFCAYHDHFSDSGNDAVYGFMSFDNFTHLAGKTCVAGQTSGDTDPNRSNYPNGDVSADAEVNTMSHEVIEAETDPHPNDTWTGPNGEIGDACNFNFAPRNDLGADVYLNGHPYIVQQEYSNAPHTCAIDLPTNGFCPGSVSNVCRPTTTFSKSVDDSTPQVNSTIHYTLTLNNTSNSGAETNLTMTDPLPAGYTVSSFTAPSSTSSSSTAGSVTVNYDTLPVHQSRTVTISATVPVQPGITATNCGVLAGSDLLSTALSPQTTSPCAATTPVKIPTTVTYTGDTSGDFNDPATVSATLTDSSSNPIAGKTIHFSLNGAETCSGVTDGSGNASCSITPGEAAGSYTVTAAFSDSTDPVYAVSSTSHGFTVTHEESNLVYTGPLTSHYHDSLTVSAKLTDPDGGAPIAGKSVTFTLGVGDTCSGTTNASGDVSCPLTSHQTGTLSLVASFAGDTQYAPSSDTKPFSTSPEETTLNYTGPTLILAGSGGATLTAKLVEDGANDSDGDGGSPGPVPAETVTLSIGSQSCTGTTDAAGNVSCTIPSVTVPLGPETVGAAFAGDARYQPASDSTTAIVFAFPSGGAFAIGDVTAATAGSAPVTWWADTWSKLNVLSGGSAPSAFKGFTNAIRLPTTAPPVGCGNAWTTTGGDSPPPASGVPSYMGVVVTSKVDKSGSTVSGNTVHIVIVKVDPGYAPNPSSHGTGTIVAVFC